MPVMLLLLLLSVSSFHAAMLILSLSGRLLQGLGGSLTIHLLVSINLVGFAGGQVRTLVFVQHFLCRLCCLCFQAFSKRFCTMILHTVLL
jgi:hypothetical protein